MIVFALHLKPDLQSGPEMFGYLFYRSFWLFTTILELKLNNEELKVQTFCFNLKVFTSRLVKGVGPLLLRDQK